MGAQFSCFLMFFFVFCVFCVFEDTSKIAVLPAWELNFRKLDQHFYVFLRFLEMLKKHVFTCLSFSCFFIIFCSFLEALVSLLASFWFFLDFLGLQNRAPMQVKLTFSQKHRFLGFYERRFTCMGAHFPAIAELPCR